MHAMLPAASTRFGKVCARCQLLAELSTCPKTLSAFAPLQSTVHKKRYTTAPTTQNQAHDEAGNFDNETHRRRGRPASRHPLKSRRYDLKIVSESLSETLAAHRGMNRVQKVHSPLVDAMDEDRRWHKTAKGIDYNVGYANLGNARNDTGLKFDPSLPLSLDPERSLKSTSSKHHEHDPISEYGDISSTPWHTRIQDPTFPLISWRKRDPAGKLLRQYPWKESANVAPRAIAVDSQTCLQDELASFAAYMSPNLEEYEARRRVGGYVSSILQNHKKCPMQTVILSEDASMPVVPHSSLMFRILVPDPAPLKTTSLSDCFLQPPNSNRHTMIKRRLHQLHLVYEALSNARTSNGDLAFAHVRLTTHGTPDPYVAARHVQSGLRVVLSSGILCSRERSDTVARYIGEFPALKALHAVFRIVLEMRGLYDGEGAFASGSEENTTRSRRNLNWFWKRKSALSPVLSQQLHSNHRCLDSYTLLVLLVASLKLGKRSWYAKDDLAGPFLDALEFLASWDMSETAISVDKAGFFPRNPQNRFYRHRGDDLEELSDERDDIDVDLDMRRLQRNLVKMNTAAFCVQDPVDPTFDLGNGISMGFQTQSVFVNLLKDVKARMAAWDNGEKEAIILEVLGTSYKSLEEWKDQLVLGAGRLDV